MELKEFNFQKTCCWDWLVCIFWYFCLAPLQHLMFYTNEKWVFPLSNWLEIYVFIAVTILTTQSIYLPICISCMLCPRNQNFLLYIVTTRSLWLREGPKYTNGSYLQKHNIETSEVILKDWLTSFSAFLKHIYFAVFKELIGVLKHWFLNDSRQV